MGATSTAPPVTAARAPARTVASVFVGGCAAIA
jgi:hypothetical protein